MKNLKYLGALVLCIYMADCTVNKNVQVLHKLEFKTSTDMQAFFRYSEHSNFIISGHRGSHENGFPENSIESLEYTLQHTPAFFEVDPRLTKDSVIVLHHDATLERTTTGTGKLADYNWEDVKKFRLKDRSGNVTPYRIPSLEEAIDWARGKTILNLDKKDVPPEMTAAIIRRKNAGSFVMVTVHNAQQAKFYIDDDPNRMMSAFVRTAEALKEYESARIPWTNMIAYVGPENKPENKALFDALHSRGVKCMISAAPKYDKLPSIAERAEAYRQTFIMGADILESDFPVEVSKAIKGIQKEKQKQKEKEKQ